MAHKEAHKEAPEASRRPEKLGRMLGSMLGKGVEEAWRQVGVCWEKTGGESLEGTQSRLGDSREILGRELREGWRRTGRKLGESWEQGVWANSRSLQEGVEVERRDTCIDSFLVMVTLCFPVHCQPRFCW